MTMNWTLVESILAYNHGLSNREHSKVGNNVGDIQTCMYVVSQSCVEVETVGAFGMSDLRCFN